MTKMTVMTEYKCCLVINCFAGKDYFCSIYIYIYIRYTNFTTFTILVYRYVYGVNTETIGQLH